MARYRIVGGIPDDNGVVELPDDARIIGALYHPITGELNVVILHELTDEELKQDKKLEQPESEKQEAKKLEDEHKEGEHKDGT